MTMPAQRPGRSKQDYATPADFIAAVKKRLGIREFTFDFAADRANAKAKWFWTIQDDSLSRTPVEWAEHATHGWGWLNSPYDHIDRWARCAAEGAAFGGSIACLWPASVGSNWFRDWVWPYAEVLALNGRLAFMPDKPAWLYPKDCMLCLYGPDVKAGAFDVWDWRA